MLKSHNERIGVMKMSDASLKIKVDAGDVRNATTELSKLERQGGATEKAASRLKAALSGVAAALSVREVVAYSDAWTNVNNKLVNTIKENEKLIDVSERVFAISQETRVSLDATATLYGRLANATADYIKDGKTIEALTSNINKAMIVSGATTAEAEGALVQLSQAFGTGILNGQEFLSVNEAAPRLMKALADSLGVARGELKSMAADGKLTAKAMFDAWGGQSALTEQINQEFANMAATAEQKTTIARNNLIKYIGTNQAAAAATKIYGDSLVGLSENLDSIAAAGTLVAGVYGGKLVGSLAASARASLADVAAKRQQIVTELALSKAAQASAESQISTLKIQQEAWAQRIKSAQTEGMAARFRQQLQSTTAQLAVAETTAAGAATRYAAAQSAAAVSTRALGGAMTFLGGPLGVAIAAATAIATFSSRSNDASSAASALSDRVQQLTADFKTLSLVEIDKTIADVEEAGKDFAYRMKLFEGLEEPQKRALAESDAIKKLTQDIKDNVAQLEALKKKREAILSGKDIDKPELPEFPPIDGGTKSKASDYIESIKRDLMTERQLIDDEYNQRVKKLNEFLKSKEITQKEFDSAEIAARQHKTNQLDAIDKKARDTAAGYLSEMQRDIMTEQQLINDDYNIKISKLNEYLSQKAITQAEYDAAELTAKIIQSEQIEELNNRQADDAIKAAKRVADEKARVDNMIIGNTQFMLQTTSDMISESGDESSTFMKMLLATQKALAIPSIIASTEQAAMAAMAHETVMGGMFSGQTAANMIRAQGAISAGLVAGQAFAGMFDKGGNIPSGKWGIGSEKRDEFINGVLVKGPARITGGADTERKIEAAARGGNGGVVINQNITVQGSGDEALISAMQEAAKQGAKDGYNQVRQDFATNGSIRRIAGV